MESPSESITYKDAKVCYQHRWPAQQVVQDAWPLQQVRRQRRAAARGAWDIKALWNPSEIVWWIRDGFLVNLPWEENTSHTVQRFKKSSKFRLARNRRAAPRFQIQQNKGNQPRREIEWEADRRGRSGGGTERQNQPNNRSTNGEEPQKSSAR
jgi:hypothetical protein